MPVARPVYVTGEVVAVDSGGVIGVSEPPFMVGEPPQWNDNSDGSYADLETFENPDVSYADAGVGALAVDESLPNASAAGVTVVAHVRYQSMNPAMAPPRVTVATDAGNSVLLTGGGTGDGAGSPTWVEIPLEPLDGDAGLLQTFLDRISDPGAPAVDLNVFAPYLFGEVSVLKRTRIYEAFLVVSIPGGLAPPCRLTSRGDFHDLGGGRLFPFAKTQQGGFRTSGTY